MPFWDYIHVGRERQQHHNLQEGLLQIASQTCSILVQVNNTNNISYGNNSTNVQYSNFSSDFCNSAGCSSNRANYETRNNNNNSNNNNNNNNNSRRNNDNSEQTAVLIPQSSSSSSTTTTTTGFRRSSTVAAKNLFTHYKHRLSTVLEGNTPTGGGDDDFELWDQNQMLRSEQHHVQKWGHGSWCKPSCIPISVILTLIVLVVLLPLLEHHNDKPSANAKGIKTPYVCTDSCSIQLVESIPEGLVYPTDSPTFLSTYDAWNKLLDIANHSIDVGSFYWTMRQDDIYNHSSSWQGEKIFQKFLNIGVRTNVKIRIAQNAPTQDQPNIDTEILIKRKAAEVRSVNFPRLIGAGVLHTKLWIIDKLHMYVGSANMDWRSLTQVKELGVLIMNCSCLVNDVSKIFNVYWDMGRNDSRIPTYWPIEYSTNYNITNPIKIDFNNNASDFYTYLSSSPPQMSPKGRAQDIDAILSVIDEAEKFIYISVMDYFPLMLYSPKTKFWPTIDNALRAAAIEHKVTIKMLISWWNHSRSSEDYFLRSLTALSNSYKGVDIEIKRFVVPSTPDQSKIPFGRVNHNKYMVTDNTAYIGTSNWSGDYFVNTAGIGLILQDSQHEFNLLNNRTTTNGNTTIRDDLVKLFERDWQSIYALDLMQ